MELEAMTHKKTIEATVGRRKVGVQRGGLVAFIH